MKMAMLPKVVEAIKDKEQEMEFSTHPLKELRFDDAWLTVDGEQYFVTETARRMLADGLRMPVAFVLFYERCIIYRANAQTYTTRRGDELWVCR
jgi:hypothetical protein